MRRPVSFTQPLVVLCLFLIALAPSALGQAQTPASTAIPHLVKFAGVLKDAQNPSPGIVGITFALYKEQNGGAPLWLETQSVQVDSQGHYSVYLGANKADGLPQDLFISGEARWLGVQPEGGAEQPRTLLLSVPYALEAGDAATVGGLPPSAFVLAPQYLGNNSGSKAGASSSDATLPPIGGSGTQNFIPLWTDNNGNLGNSVMFQSGSGSSAKTGVNTTTPAATLDINGNTIARGAVQLPSTGTANASQGFNSQPFSLQGSAFNSSTQQAIGPVFQWQTEPTGNNSSNPSGTLNLLYGPGTGSPAETGLNIASNGKITFANGQTFPGTGTITGVTAGTGLTGGGTSGNVTLSINVGFANQNYARLGATNTFTKNQIVNAPLSAQQLISTAPQGTAPLQVTSTTQVPNLNASLLGGFSAGAFQPAGSYATLGSNSFNGSQNVTGDLTASGTVSATAFNATTSFNLGGSPIAFGSPSGNNPNAYLGFSGNQSSTGINNFGGGFAALLSNTTGSGNTATGTSAMASNTTGGGNSVSGLSALASNTSGSDNSAFGELALAYNTTGSSNTALGSFAGLPTSFVQPTGSQTTFLGANSNPGNLTTLNNATAIGANAQVTASNAMVLGSINGVNGATADTLVGIGTTAPLFKLDVHGNANFTGPITFASGQTFPGTGTVTSVGSGAGLTGGPITGSGSLSIASGGVTNAMLANSSLTVAAGTDLIGGGSVALGGTTTLNLDTSKVPQLNTPNTFVGDQTVAGNVNVGTVNVYEIGGLPFAFGSHLNSNVFLGFAGNLTNFAGYNTAVGVSALLNDAGGGYNTAVGEQALTANTGGVGNIAVGFQAMYSNTNGNSNTAVGTGSLYFNTTGADNTATGDHALANNTIGSNNTAVGGNALLSNTTAGNNTAMGVSALQNNLSGANNTAVGANALLSNTSAFSNTAIGVQALTANTTGGNNTASGQGALGSNTTGGNNAATGVSALLRNTTGGNNTAIGTSALQSNLTGSQLTCIGFSCDVAVDGVTNATAIGAKASVTQSNSLVLGSIAGINGASNDTKVGIGTNAPTNVFTIATGKGHAIADGWDTYSSRRWKTNIQILPDALAKVEQLRGVSYDLKDSGKHEIGVIAEEVGAVLPEVVTFEANGKDARGVDYSRLTALLIEAVKQQQKQLRQQQAQCRALRTQLRQQAVKDALLEARLAKLERSVTDNSRLAAYRAPASHATAR